MRKGVLFILIFLVLFVASAVLSLGVSFTGHTYNISGGNLSNVNITIKLYDMLVSPDTPFAVYTNLSDVNGSWSISVPDSNVSQPTTKMIQFEVVKYKGSGTIYAEKIGSLTPNFPYLEIYNMLNLSSVNFYLKDAATINITAVNSSNVNIAFNYMIKDTKLGYPISYQWTSSIYSKSVNVPADRNYSIMLYPTNGMPVYYDLNNLSDYNAKNISIVFNISDSPVRISGNCSLQNGTRSFNELSIVTYLMEPGDMVFMEQPMPFNMSQSPGDNYTESEGRFNITLMGTAMSNKVLMLAIGRIGDEFYAGYRNVSPSLGDSEIHLNFTLYKMLGDESNITVRQMNQGVTPYKNISVKKTTFALYNSTNSSILTSASAHIEMEVRYSRLDSTMPDITFMSDVEQSDNGKFYLPLLNYSIYKMNVFSQNFAPRELSYTQAQMNASQINITMESFNPGGIGEDFTGISMAMYKSSPECDVPQPPSSCILSGGKNESEFRPLNAVISGGKISMRITKDNVTVHYKNVDLLASGPPDAMFDDNANESSSGGLLEQAWRFGSKGPEMYDEILVGMPYNDSLVDENAPLRILISSLYNNEWSEMWNTTAGHDPEDLPEEYNSTFNLTWFNTTVGGMPCSTTDDSQPCFINTTTNMIWLTIPHFSGVGPTVKSVSVGGVSINSSSTLINCTNNCTVYFNITSLNYTLETVKRKIWINGSLTSSVNYTMDIFWYNNSQWNLNGTNYSTFEGFNLTRYNGSSFRIHKYRINLTKTNNSNTYLTIVYNISGVNSVLNLSVRLGGVSPVISTISSTASSTTATLSVTTNENSTCRYSSSDVAYSSMSGTMSADSAGTSHTASLSGLTSSVSYTYYVRCRNFAGNTMTSSRSTTFTTSSTSTTSSSSGGGGAAVVIKEEPKSSRMWAKLDKDEPVKMEITNKEIAVLSIGFTAKEKMDNPGLTVKVKDSNPTGKSLSGKAYQYLSIERTNIPEDQPAKISFKVNKSWITENNIIESTVVLMRYKDGWSKLSTKKTSSDSQYLYFEAETPGFSYFAVVGEKLSAQEEAQKAESSEESKPAEKTGSTTEPSSQQAEEAGKEEGSKSLPEDEEMFKGEEKLKSNWFVYIGIAILILGAIGITYYEYERKKKHKKSK